MSSVCEVQTDKSQVRRTSPLAGVEHENHARQIPYQFCPKILIPKNKARGKKPQGARRRAGKARNGEGKRGNLITTSQSGLTGFGELWTPLYSAKVRKRLRYSSNTSLISTAGTVASWVVSANGLFDPDISGTGHQPMGFDQMMLSYEHYTVVSARIIVTFKNTATNVPTVCITVSPSPTPITVIDQILEFGALTSNVLEIKGDYGANKKLRASCNLAKLNGAGNILDFNVLRGDVANNPAEQTYFILQMWDSSAAGGSCNIDYVIEFDAWFTEPRQLSESLRRTMSKALLQESKVQKA